MDEKREHVWRQGVHSAMVKQRDRRTRSEPSNDGGPNHPISARRPPTGQRSARNILRRGEAARGTIGPNQSLTASGLVSGSSGSLYSQPPGSNEPDTPSADANSNLSFANELQTMKYYGLNKV